MKRLARDVTIAELRQLAGDEAGVIIEAGANDGEDSLRLLEAFPNCRLVAFEPDPRAILKLRKTVGDNPRVDTHELALGESWYRALFHQSSGNPYQDRECDWDKSGSLMRPTEHLNYSPWCKFDKRIGVQVGRLDGILAESHDRIPLDLPVQLIWLDVQGAELKALDGAEKTLGRTMVVKAECHRVPMYEGAPTQMEMIEWMDARGFVPEGAYADDLVFIRRA